MHYSQEITLLQTSFRPSIAVWIIKGHCIMHKVQNWNVVTSTLDKTVGNYSFAWEEDDIDSTVVCVPCMDDLNNTVALAPEVRFMNDPATCRCSKAQQMVTTWLAWRNLCQKRKKNRLTGREDGKRPPVPNHELNRKGSCVTHGRKNRWQILPPLVWHKTVRDLSALHSLAPWSTLPEISEGTTGAFSLADMRRKDSLALIDHLIS